MHGKKIMRNSIIGVTYRVVILFLGFVSRRLFIHFIGDELLGLNSLYANLLDLLNLADLGLGVAVQYQLYEPIVQKDYEKVSGILCAARRIFNLIGICILILGVVMSAMIQYLIKETTYPMWFVRSAFLISVTGIALSYFFVHKRLFFTANEDISITNVIDMVIRIITVTVSLISIIVTKNYLIYLGINAVNGLVSNLIVSFVFRKKYPQIKLGMRAKISSIRGLTKDLKQVVPLKLSNYVYNSTDSIVMSKFHGLIAVTLYANYMTLINAIMNIEYIMGNAVMASMGKLIKETDDRNRVFDFYMNSQYLQVLLANFCTVSFVILSNPFISLWYGEKYLLGNGIFALLMVDFFIHTMYQPAYVVYGATGQFQKDKYITIASAVMNIVISVLLARVIGLAGVIIGTLVTDIYIWIVRSWQMVGTYFGNSLSKYAWKMGKYCVITVASVAAAVAAASLVPVQHAIPAFFLKMLICCIVPNAIGLLTTAGQSEFRYCMQFIRNRF